MRSRSPTPASTSRAKSLLVSITGATNAADCDALIPLRSVNPYDGVRGGLTALPNANAASSGGLPTVGTGADQINLDGSGNVYLSSGSGANQISLSSGKVTVGTNSDKTGYSLTQAFPSNFSSLAITSGSGYVTVGTNEDKTGYSLATAPPTAAAIATAVLSDTGDNTTPGSVGYLIAQNLNATVSSRSTYAGTDTAGTTTLLSRLTQAILFDGSGYVKANAEAVSDKTGYALTQSFPANFALLGITSAGKIGEVALVDTLTTYTGNTPQTGDVYGIVSNGSYGNSAIAALLAAVGSEIVGLGSPLQAGAAVVLASSQPNYAPAKAGQQMDLVGAPNTTAITAIQSGLATAANQTTELQILQADRVIDTTTDPTQYHEVLYVSGTSTVLLTKKLYDVAGNKLNSTSTIPGQWKQ